jgi:hypothetical protein
MLFTMCRSALYACVCLSLLFVSVSADPGLWLTTFLATFPFPRSLFSASYVSNIQSFTLTGAHPNYALFSPFSNDGVVNDTSHTLQIASVPFLIDAVRDHGAEPTLDHVH